MNEETQQHQFLWLDVETTGLDPHADTILELACALVEDGPEGSFEIVDAWEAVASGEVDGGQRRFRPTGAKEWIDVHARVWDMHSVNGLWHEAASFDAVPLAVVDVRLADWLSTHGVKQPRSVVLAGNSVHFDLGFIRANMPMTTKLMHHRVFDVSTLLVAARLWATPVDRLEPAHRALADVVQSIEFAKACRASLVGAK